MCPDEYERHATQIQRSCALPTRRHLRWSTRRRSSTQRLGKSAYQLCFMGRTGQLRDRQGRPSLGVAQAAPVLARLSSRAGQRRRNPVFRTSDRALSGQSLDRRPVPWRPASRRRQVRDQRKPAFRRIAGGALRPGGTSGKTWHRRASGSVPRILSAPGLAFPLVVKPVRGRGSQGVSRVPDFPALIGAATRLLDQGLFGALFILEQYL